MVLGPTIQNSNPFKSIQFKSIQFKLIQFYAFQLYFILFNMFQDFVNIWIISELIFFFHHGLRSTDIKFNSFQFHTHAYFLPAKRDFLYIKVHEYNIFNLILIHFMSSFVKKHMLQNFVYIVNLHNFRSNFFFIAMVLDMKIQNLIYFNSSQLLQHLTYFRSNFISPQWS